MALSRNMTYTLMIVLPLPPRLETIMHGNVLHEDDLDQIIKLPQLKSLRVRQSSNLIDSEAPRSGLVRAW